MSHYDRRARIITANMSLQDYYEDMVRKVRAQQFKLEAAAAAKSLKEAKHFLSQIGLNLDIKRSSLENYRVGSDSMGYDVWLHLTDMWDRGPALTDDFVAASVFDACRFQPKVKSVGQGVWTAEASWGG